MVTGDSRVGEALTKSKNSCADCGGAMVRTEVVKNTCWRNEEKGSIRNAGRSLEGGDDFAQNTAAEILVRPSI